MAKKTASARTADKPGVLLVNLGTPDSPTAPALKRYLAEFLSDPDVVTLPRILWLPFLHLVVLRTRPVRSAEAYARIWTPKGSPLLVNSRALAVKLQAALPKRLGATVALGMRYGNPSIESALTALRKAGVTRLLVLPLYPQYAVATTASTFSAVRRSLKQMHWSPRIATLHDYHTDPVYISALAKSVREYWKKHGRGKRLLISFHGIPKQVSDAGDPYAEQCETTAKALAMELKLTEGAWQATYQSRFGPAEWLKPYTETALKECAVAGMGEVDVICPGFPADCLETLEEIGLRYAESFRAGGGKNLRYIPALNARADHVKALTEIAVARLKETG